LVEPLISCHGDLGQVVFDLIASTIDCALNPCGFLVDIIIDIMKFALTPEALLNGVEYILARFSVEIDPVYRTNDAGTVLTTLIDRYLPYTCRHP